MVLLLIGITAVFAAVFSLYDLPLEAIGYAAALCLALGAGVFLLGFWRFRSRHGELRADKRTEPLMPLPLPEICWRKITRPC
ncbi:MAG: hypothetical protein V8R55_07510 [Dysosmobacter sp.]